MTRYFIWFLEKRQRAYDTVNAHSVWWLVAASNQSDAISMPAAHSVLDPVLQYTCNPDIICLTTASPAVGSFLPPNQCSIRLRVREKVTAMSKSESLLVVHARLPFSGNLEALLGRV